jgi:hypothetical protein
MARRGFGNSFLTAPAPFGKVTRNSELFHGNCSRITLLPSQELQNIKTLYPFVVLQKVLVSIY